MDGNWVFTAYHPSNAYGPSANSALPAPPMDPPMGYGNQRMMWPPPAPYPTQPLGYALDPSSQYPPQMAYGAGGDQQLEQQAVYAASHGQARPPKKTTRGNRGGANRKNRKPNRRQPQGKRLPDEPQPDDEESDGSNTVLAPAASAPPASAQGASQPLSAEAPPFVPPSNQPAGINIVPPPQNSWRDFRREAPAHVRHPELVNPMAVHISIGSEQPLSRGVDPVDGREKLYEAPPIVNRALFPEIMSSADKEERTRMEEWRRAAEGASRRQAGKGRVVLSGDGTGPVQRCKVTELEKVQEQEMLQCRANRALGCAYAVVNR